MMDDQQLDVSDFAEHLKTYYSTRKMIVHILKWAIRD